MVPVSYTHLDVYKRQVYNSIREFGYNLKTTPIVFVGGGAVVMKNFGNHDAKNIYYNLDVKANARGYEQLATMGLKSTCLLYTSIPGYYQQIHSICPAVYGTGKSDY